MTVVQGNTASLAAISLLSTVAPEDRKTLGNIRHSFFKNEFPVTQLTVSKNTDRNSQHWPQTETSTHRPHPFCIHYRTLEKMGVASKPLPIINTKLYWQTFKYSWQINADISSLQWQTNVSAVNCRQNCHDWELTIHDNWDQYVNQTYKIFQQLNTDLCQITPINFSNSIIIGPPNGPVLYCMLSSSSVTRVGGRLLLNQAHN